MKTLLSVLAVTLLCGGMAHAEQSEPETIISIKGEWGTLECKPHLTTVYLPADREVVVIGNGRVPIDIRKPVPVCDVRVTDVDGKVIDPIGGGCEYFINGRSEKVSLFSSNQSVVKVSGELEGLLGETGKTTMIVKFLKQSAKFQVAVVRTKIAIGMNPSQVTNILGRPSIRLRGYSTGVEYWRWEKKPELEVCIGGNKVPSVFSVKSEKILTDKSIEELKREGRLLEDSRKREALEPSDKEK